jgi:hypothetical protein
MHWKRPGGSIGLCRGKAAILTDSGGFQVFSLANRREVSEEGVIFSSHVDGARHHLTPETVVSAQMRMGVDIAMCLDECPPYPCSESEARDMMERTLRWAARAKETWVSGWEAYQNTNLFPIVQGATFPELRKESARRTVELDLPGYALGGLVRGGTPGNVGAHDRGQCFRTSERQTPLPDGGGSAGRHVGGGRTGHRYVRLCLAHAERSERPGAHVPGAAQSADQRLPSGRPSLGRGLFLPHLPAIHAAVTSPTSFGRGNTPRSGSCLYTIWPLC